MKKQKAFFLSQKEIMRISESLGIMIADQDWRETSVNLRWDRALLKKWDSLVGLKRVQVMRGGK